MKSGKEKVGRKNAAVLQVLKALKNASQAEHKHVWLWTWCNWANKYQSLATLKSATQETVRLPDVWIESGKRRVGNFLVKKWGLNTLYNKYKQTNPNKYTCDCSTLLQRLFTKYNTIIIINKQSPCLAFSSLSK